MKSEMKAASLALGLLALVGCTLTQSELRKAGDESGKVVIGGRQVASKMCIMKVAILSRPIKDEAINDILWRSADEQAIPAEVRRAMEANGLRAGVVTGDLPPEVKEILEANSPPPKGADVTTHGVSSGDPSQVALGSAPQLSLFVKRQDSSVGGKTYSDARGFLRLTASYDNGIGVALRATPEMHHGAYQQGWAMAPSAGPMAPMQFIPRSGQQEESYRDMAADLVLQPGQVAVFGSLPDRRGSLGDFLFTTPEANSDRTLQRVVLIWASRGDPGPSGPARSTAPKLEPAEPPDMPARSGEAAEAKANGRGKDEDGSPETASRR